jgi:superfamily II DNA or RNA helicase
MAVSLRPFQATAVAEIRGAYMAGHRRVLFVLPTGGGKTYTFVHIAEQAAIRGNRVCILVHRQELVDQSSRSLHAIGCNHGVIAAGYRQDLRQGVQVASVQTLARRLHTIPPDFFQLLIVDEAHHAVAGTWAKVLAAMPRAHVLGVTATPERLDGRGLGDQFDTMILGPDAGWLTQEGFLVRARVFAPPGIDLSAVKRFDTKKGRTDSDSILRQGQAMGDAVSHYRRTIADVYNGSAIAFCCSVAHAEAVAEAFRAQGIAAATLEGTMDRGIRRRTIADLGTGHRGHPAPPHRLPGPPPAAGRPGAQAMPREAPRDRQRPRRQRVEARPSHRSPRLVPRRPAQGPEAQVRCSPCPDLPRLLLRHPISRQSVPRVRSRGRAGTPRAEDRRG